MNTNIYELVSRMGVISIDLEKNSSNIDLVKRDKYMIMSVQYKVGTHIISELKDLKKAETLSYAIYGYREENKGVRDCIDINR